MWSGEFVSIEYGAKEVNATPEETAFIRHVSEYKDKAKWSRNDTRVEWNIKGKKIGDLSNFDIHIFISSSVFFINFDLTEVFLRFRWEFHWQIADFTISI